MRMKDIDSEAIKRWGYDPALRLFDVEFITGSIYEYSDVSPETYAEGEAADSKGTWFNTVFKAMGHKYKEKYRPPHLPPRKPGQPDHWLH